MEGIICLEELRKATKNLPSPGRDLNPASPEYKAGDLTTGPRRSFLVQYHGRLQGKSSYRG